MLDTRTRILTRVFKLKVAVPFKCGQIWLIIGPVL